MERIALAFLLGALEDAALISRPEKGEYVIEMEQKNKKWLEIVASSVEAIFGKKPKIKKRKRGYYRLRFYSKEAYSFLTRERENMFGNWKSMSKEEMIAFLRGVFDAEGSVLSTRYVISLGNKDEKLLRICKEMLRRLGIKCGNITRSTKSVKKISIYGKDNLLLFKKLIGFSHPDKRKKLDALLGP